MKSLDESHQRRRIEEVQQAFLALPSGIDHRARKSGLLHQRGERCVGAEVGEHHPDDLHSRRQRREGADASLAPGVRKQADLDVVDAGRGERPSRRDNDFGLHRQIAGNCADRRPPSNFGDDLAHRFRRERPERADPRVLRIDEVRALLARDPGLIRAGDAGEKTGQLVCPK